MARTTSTTWRAGWRRWSWRWTATRTAAPSGIVDTARRTAALYLMQFHHVMEDEAQ